MLDRRQLGNITASKIDKVAPMIRLVDLLKLQGVTLENESYKIHLATSDESPPLDAYLAGTFKEWQENQTKKNFECKMVLSLIHLGGDRWLFVGVYGVKGVQPGQTTAFKYETQLLPGHEELIGRVVVKSSASIERPTFGVKNMAPNSRSLRF